MSLPFVGRVVDERYLNHRLRSTSLAGIVGTVLALLLFEYHFFFDHVWNWDLLAVALAFVGVKLAAMVWFWLRD
jgi:protein-S-isoprenylcysteine O-methyltransferase Ste14